MKKKKMVTSASSITLLCLQRTLSLNTKILPPLLVHRRYKAHAIMPSLKKGRGKTLHSYSEQIILFWLFLSFLLNYIFLFVYWILLYLTLACFVFVFLGGLFFFLVLFFVFFTPLAHGFTQHLQVISSTRALSLL